jgi:hypothetical protein
MNKMIVVASLAAVLASGAVLAAETQAPPAAHHTKSHHHSTSTAAHAEFKRLDVNKDGYIESSEAQADKALSAEFEHLAKHGKISRASFLAWKHHQTARAHPAETMQKKPAGDADK